MCERSELVNISQLFGSFSQTRHLTVKLSQPKPKENLKISNMTRQFQLEKRYKNVHISGQITHCAIESWNLKLKLRFSGVWRAKERQSLQNFVSSSWRKKLSSTANDFSHIS